MKGRKLNGSKNFEAVGEMPHPNIACLFWNGRILWLPAPQTFDILRLAKPPGLCRKARYLAVALVFLAEAQREVYEAFAHSRTTS